MIDLFLYSGQSPGAHPEQITSNLDSAEHQRARRPHHNTRHQPPGDTDLGQGAFLFGTPIVVSRTAGNQENMIIRTATHLISPFRNEPYVRKPVKFRRDKGLFAPIASLLPHLLRDQRQHLRCLFSERTHTPCQNMCADFIKASTQCCAFSTNYKTP